MRRFLERNPGLSLVATTTSWSLPPFSAATTDEFLGFSAEEREIVDRLRKELESELRLANTHVVTRTRSQGAR